MQRNYVEETAVITEELIAEYKSYLYKEEKSRNTVSKYIRDIRAFSAFMDGGLVRKENILAWKEKLQATHSPASINSMLAAVNGFFDWLQLPELKVKPLKIQREIFSKPGEGTDTDRIFTAGGNRGKRTQAPAGAPSADHLFNRDPGIRTEIYYCGSSEDGPCGSGLQGQNPYCPAAFRAGPCPWPLLQQSGDWEGNDFLYKKREAAG